MPSFSIDATNDFKTVVGQKLFDGAKAEALLTATTRTLKKTVESAQEDCGRHRQTEQRLQAELGTAREARRVESIKVARLRALVNEIARALKSGRVLSDEAVLTGMAKALNLKYKGDHFLPDPPTTAADGGTAGDKTDAAAAEPATAPKSETGDATAAEQT